MSESINRNLHFEVSTIETIDKSVLNFVKSLGLSTTTNKGFQPVPIVWGTAERSFQAKGNKDIRDEQGLLIMPIITIKRSSFTKSRTSQGVFQGNIPEADDASGGSVATSRVLYQQKTMKFANADALKLYGQKNFPSNNPKIVYRTVSVPMPVNVEVMYEITLRTEYQQQMNDLMTPFATRPGTVNFVRLIEKDHRYEGFIQEGYANSDNISDFSSDERKFETKITLKVIGYIVGEGKNREKPHYAIRENAVEVKIPRERISLAEIPEHEFGSYYGLEGMPPDIRETLFMDPVSLSNTPAAAFFGSSGNATNVSSNVVTTDNFADTLKESMIIRETLLNPGDNLVGDAPYSFTTKFTIKQNSEQVVLNGILQADGIELGPNGKDYIITNGNTITFNVVNNDSFVKNGDQVVITYIKG